MSLMQQPPSGTSEHGRFIGIIPKSASEAVAGSVMTDISRRASKLGVDGRHITTAWKRPTPTFLRVDSEPIPKQSFPQRTQLACYTRPPEPWETIKRLVVGQTGVAITESFLRQLRRHGGSKWWAKIRQKDEWTDVTIEAFACQQCR
ncbi:MAG: hypothetical protein MMC33_005555 [Icmadophila ericetorum]|nr:hypothetical protein [Icmadophila ericetorum]